MTSKNNHYSEWGVTSLFIVLFASLLLSIITVSFAAMMIREQQRSTDDEQSQSAYDAALAGVEDGKRVIAACNNGNQTACNAINAHECTTVTAASIQTGEANGEVKLQTAVAADGRELNQAYTCVVISRNTDNVKKVLEHDASVMIPIRATGNFNQVVVSWHTSDDATTSLVDGALAELPQLSAWPAARPALLRAQLMQYDSSIGITPSDFDDGPNAHTLYLQPQTTVNSLSFSLDNRRSGNLELQAATCVNGGFSVATGYSCQAVIQLPNISNRAGYLRLTSFYNSTHLMVELRNSANTNVDFEGVQPSIDSTGRANDLFRRVEARIDSSNTSFPYPRATVDITNNFCKTFSVSAQAADYDDGAALCDPTIAGPTP